MEGIILQSTTSLSEMIHVSVKVLSDESFYLDGPDAE